MSLETIFHWKPKFIEKFLERKKVKWVRKWLPIERIGGLIMIAMAVIINPWLAFLAIVGLVAVFFPWIKKALEKHVQEGVI